MRASHQDAPAAKTPDTPSYEVRVAVRKAALKAKDAGDWRRFIELTTLDRSYEASDSRPPPLRKRESPCVKVAQNLFGVTGWSSLVVMALVISTALGATGGVAAIKVLLVLAVLGLTALCRTVFRRVGRKLDSACDQLTLGRLHCRWLLSYRRFWLYKLETGFTGQRSRWTRRF
jgi:hypothetical protein